MIDNAIASIIKHLNARPLRTWSLIISLFGDAVVPRGGEVDLATLSAFCAGLDIDVGAVRTALSRLVRDGWLTRQKRGRNSFYRLSAEGHAQFVTASSRIYAPPVPAEGSTLTLLLAPEAARAEVAAACSARGFGVAQPGLFVAVQPDRAMLPAGALALQVAGDAASLRELAARAWPLDHLAAHYHAFMSAFSPLATALAARLAPQDMQALLARVLLIHEYRRIALRDPLLPHDLLPQDWPGIAARRLCASLYGQLFKPAEAWLDSHATTSLGTALPASRATAARFVP
ncbi:MAG: phenylacetic acid degradation operon negative regulatory protein PaaX [Hyphomicrobiales bacterium]|nr:phenylacetic acid degradation operon negative regulatory protein PaaX [Hyphomicrobiales bacterium]